MYALIFIIALTGEIIVPAFSETLEECESYAESMFEDYSTSWICAKVESDPIIIGRKVINVPSV